MLQLSHEHSSESLSGDRQVYDHRRIANLNRVLADIDLVLAIEIERLKSQDGGIKRARTLIETLLEEHNQRRKPFIGRLAELSSETTG